MAMTQKHAKVVRACIKIIICIIVLRSYFQYQEFKKITKDLQRDELTSEKLFGPLSKEDALLKVENDLSSRAFALRHPLGFFTEDDEDNENCTRRGIESFPTLLTNEQRLNGAIIINFLVAFYMCGMIGYNCDIYFVPALEVIVDELKIKPDVAGATFMAIGSSAPEFFTAVIGTFISEDDTGLSAIVGSAAFNVFVIISFCCFFAKTAVPLTGWPLFRDGVCYIISVLLLVITIYDSQVQWWEGLIMIVGYLLYILLIYFNSFFSEKAAHWLHPERTKETDTTSLIGQGNLETSYGASGERERESSFSKPCSEVNEERSQEKDQNGFIRSDKSDPMDSPISEYKQSYEFPEVFTPPEGIVYRGLWILGLPTIVLMYITIPDVTQPRWRKYYFVSFFMSLVWLMGTSYVLYWMIVVMGYTFDIPDTVMGITLLAGGTSVPDLLSSVIVARHGFGDMALSNVIGSNLFDVLICLGLPWSIKALVFEPVTIATDGLTFTSITLMLTVLIVVIAIHVNGWKLNIKLGVLCFAIYVVFITFAILRELGIVGGTVPPFYCPGPP
ncbi:sodium/potassium/calcium exchanger 5-like [Amphiura filiformis]|uniref:sodium/potassium/calcium exchanger 5-like n=1 Tax=Amphiura filiformis TaxID=82378 RepID=UPI003B21BBBF